METKPWYRQKTTWACLAAGGVVALGGAFGFLSAEQIRAVYDLAIAGAIVFLRQAVNKLPSAG